MSRYPIQFPVWSPAIAVSPLQPNELHIWRASLDQPDDVMQNFFEMLAIDERERAQRFRFEHHRRRAIASRGILRSILARYLHQCPDQLRFHYSEHGKPSLVQDKKTELLRFNVTHSENLALFAIATSADVGIDIEIRHSIPMLPQLIQRYCSAQEQATIAAQPLAQQEDCFFYHWTAKEALTKVTGRGLVDLAKVELVLTSQGAQGLYEPNPENLTWHVYLIEPQPGYAGAVAYTAPTPRSLLFWDW